MLLILGGSLLRVRCCVKRQALCHAGGPCRPRSACQRLAATRSSACSPRASARTCRTSPSARRSPTSSGARPRSVCARISVMRLSSTHIPSDFARVRQAAVHNLPCWPLHNAAARPDRRERPPPRVLVSSQPAANMRAARTRAAGRVSVSEKSNSASACMGCRLCLQCVHQSCSPYHAPLATSTMSSRCLLIIRQLHNLSVACSLQMLLHSSVARALAPRCKHAHHAASNTNGWHS